MIKRFYLAVLILLMGISIISVASSEDQVTQTIYVHEEDLNGTLLSGVQVTGQDAAGDNFEGMTNSNGVAVVGGQPGAWKFVFTKEGYETLDLSYDVLDTDVGAVYLNKTGQSHDQVSQTVYVHEGDLNGTLLSGVQVAGQDAAGNNFEGMTDSNGVAVVGGQPGAWKFIFIKEGYETLDLSYDVPDTGVGAVYLVRSGTSQEQNTLPQNNSQTEAISEATTAGRTQFGTDATVPQKIEANESEIAYPEFWLKKGNSLYEQDRYDEAAVFYDRAIMLNPQLEAAWFNKGNALYMQGDYNEALQTFDKALEINPQDAIACNCRGLTLIKLGRNVEANAAFIRARDLGYTG